MVHRFHFAGAIVAATVFATLCGTCPAQSGSQYSGGPFPTIRIPNLERVINEARYQAMKDARPEVEFYMVKTHIREYVNERRQSMTQEIRFDYPDKFRDWLKDIAKRCDLDEDRLAREIVGALAPNRCPDLKRNDARTPDDLKSRALEEMRSRQAAAATRPPAPADTIRRNPERTQPTPERQRPDSEATARDADSSTAPRTIIVVGTEPAATETDDSTVSGSTTTISAGAIEEQPEPGQPRTIITVGTPTPSPGAAGRR